MHKTNQEHVCSECGKEVDLIDFKMTLFYYDTILCSRCELRLIEIGYWTEEKKVEILRKRKEQGMI